MAVVGGGNSAVDEALYLSDIAEKVYLIHRRHELRAEAYLQERVFARANLEIIWDAVVAEVVGEVELGHVLLENVRTEERTALQVDGLLVAIGHAPQTAWLEGVTELTEGGFVATDCLMRTGEPGLFAAGDVRETPLRQITTAVGDATLAAYSAYQYLSALAEQDVEAVGHDEAGFRGGGSPEGAPEGVPQPWRWRWQRLKPRVRILRSHSRLLKRPLR